jgi:hypothetical protein
MNLQRRLVWGVFLCLGLALAAARSQDETFTEPKSGKTFPKKITLTLEGKEVTLTATGAIHFVKEGKKASEGKSEGAQYAMAHYLEAVTVDSGNTVYSMILEKPVVKQMIFAYENEATAEASRKIYSRFFAKVASPAELEQNQIAIEEFLAAVSVPLQARERVAFRWLPDNRLTIILPNEPEKILRASPIASWFWKSWFGDESPFDRAGLVEKFAAQ